MPVAARPRCRTDCPCTPWQSSLPAADSGPCASTWYRSAWHPSPSALAGRWRRKGCRLLRWTPSAAPEPAAPTPRPAAARRTPTSWSAAAAHAETALWHGPVAWEEPRRVQGSPPRLASHSLPRLLQCPRPSNRARHPWSRTPPVLNVRPEQWVQSCSQALARRDASAPPTERTTAGDRAPSSCRSQRPSLHPRSAPPRPCSRGG
mmetsp:Transcript_2138/g.4841  ORF Transcript_2138/g.4841 Transcript_2138/m.4841 type:complete len:205 (-) Transcript_2138:345-959(-)